jgi:flagellar protein FliO/FliZ
MSGHNRRLKIIETLPVGAKHKAVLIQRDDRQHLILLGANSDTVIETNIKPPKIEVNAKN